MRRAAFVSVAMLLIAVPVFAQNANYAVAKLGMYFPTASDLEDFDNGFDGELAFGRYFHKNLAAELGIGYMSTSNGIHFIGPDLDLTIVPVTVAAKGLLPMGRWAPYAIGGIGAYFVEVETTTGSVSRSEKDTAFGVFLGVGVDVNITERFFMGLEGKYFWAKPTLDGEDVNVDGIDGTLDFGFRF